MHELAIGGVAVGGIGGGAFVVLLAISYLLRFVLQFSRRGQGYTSMRWPGQGPGGIGQQGPDAAPSAPSPQDAKRREQAHAYWEAEEPPEGTLAAEGFIGDDPEADPGTGRDSEPTDRLTPEG
jgi:hypothetical protein